jgi:hypothetical protein
MDTVPLWRKEPSQLVGICHVCGDRGDRYRKPLRFRSAVYPLLVCKKCLAFVEERLSDPNDPAVAHIMRNLIARLNRKRKLENTP